MTIAITGATGFVGQALLDAAARARVSLRALTRSPQEPREGVEWILGGLSDQGALNELTRGATTVIHVAGLTTTSDPRQFEQANVAGTLTLLDAAREAGVGRFVFVSSLSAREPALSAYGASKARAEEHVTSSGLDWTIVRPPGVYGPRDIDYFEMFRSAKVGLVPLPPAGASSIIHVEDLARLLLDLVDAPPALVYGQLFEPDDGREGGWSHNELARAIGQAIGRRVFAPHLPASLLRLGAKADRLIRGDKARLTADRVGYMTHPDWVARRVKAVPRAVWEPRISGDTGLARTAEWYRQSGWL